MQPAWNDLHLGWGDSYPFLAGSGQCALQAPPTQWPEAREPEDEPTGGSPQGSEQVGRTFLHSLSMWAQLSAVPTFGASIPSGAVHLGPALAFRAEEWLVMGVLKRSSCS